MLSFIDPIVCIVHACDAKDSGLHTRNVHLERSMGLKQRTALYSDGEWVCTVLWAVFSPCHNPVTLSTGSPLMLPLLFSVVLLLLQQQFAALRPLTKPCSL